MRIRLSIGNRNGPSTNMKIDLLIKTYKQMYGQARYAISLCKGMSEIGAEYSVVHPHHPLLLKPVLALSTRLGYDPGEFLGTFPIAAHFRQDSVRHLTTQQMGSLLSCHPTLKRTVVTVHDIVPYLVRDDADQNEYRHVIERCFDRLSLWGLGRADRIIAISSFTKKTLLEFLKLREDRIRVVPYGLDHDFFRPVSVTEEFRARYDLSAGFRYVLYVGSANPRKNLPRLIKAFAQVVNKVPDAKLLQVGTLEHGPAYCQLLELIGELGLQDSIHFYSHPPQEDLIAFYSLADVFVFPSLFEGFGMPPLEAMACGTAVVCSNAASLPEVVGNAAVLVDPYDPDAMAEAMYEVLCNRGLREELQQRGLRRASQFSWEQAARETFSVYEEVLGKMQ